jgi:hypothetical protein
MIRKVFINLRGLAEKTSVERGETVMRLPENIEIFVLLAIILMLELAGAGAYAASSAHVSPADYCFGYAICH